MTSDSLNRPPIEVGGIVATGWNLYRKHFSQYALIALRGHLWLFIPATIGTLVGNLGAQLPDRYVGLSLLLAVAFIVFYIICGAKYFGWVTGVSRLAYQNLRGTVDEREALRFTRSRQYPLLGTNLLKGLILTIPTIVWLIAVGIIAGRSGLTFEMLEQPELIDPAVVGRIILISLPVSLIFLVLVVWLGLRTMLADQSLAIEQESDAISAIGRSWKLVKGSVLRSFLVVFVAYLFILPVSFLLSTFGQAISVSLFNVVPPEEVVLNSVGDALPYVGAAVVLTIFSTLAGVITVPLWQTMATTLYVRLVEKLMGESLAADGAGGQPAIDG